MSTIAMGFVPYKSIVGATYNQALNANFYYILPGEATSIFTGDPVLISNTGPNKGYITAATGTGGNNTGQMILGIFQGCTYYNPATKNYIEAPYWPGGQTTLNGLIPLAVVSDDPNTIYNAYTVGDSGVTLALGQENFSYTVGAGNPANGRSGYLVNVASANATANTFRLIGLTPIQGINPNVLGVANNQGLFLINNHYYKAPTAGNAGN